MGSLFSYFGLCLPIDNEDLNLGNKYNPSPKVLLKTPWGFMP